MRPRARQRRLRVVALLSGCLLLVAAPVGAQEVAVARVVVDDAPAADTAPAVDPDDEDDEDETGPVTVTPDVQGATTADVVWQVTNRAATTVTVALSVVTIAPDDDGAVVAAGPLGDVVLETPTIRLDPDERAVVTLARTDVADRLVDGLALLASSPDDRFDDLVGVVVAGRAAPTGLVVELARDDGRLRGSVALTTGRAVVVDVRARLVAWPSRVVADRVVRDVVLLPPGREVDLELGGAVFVGPVDLEVVAGTGEDVADASARAWIVNRTAVRTTGGVVLGLTALVVGLAVLRQRRRAA